ncbi:MAG: extracellular solute-binding protein [Solirubrobacterales bacterium]
MKILNLTAALCLTVVLAACGGSSGTTDVATAPEDLDQPSTGELRVFAYEDSVTPEMMKPFEEQNPDLNIKTATFDSNAEAAAKLAGGFEADVIEICLDEAEPLLQRKQLRPIDTAAVTDWDQLAFRNEPEVRQDGEVIMVPLSAGPHGVIYDPTQIDQEIDSFKDVFDPEFAGRSALGADFSLTPIAVAALAMGMEDPMDLSQEELDQVSDYLDENRDQFRALWRSDSDLVNLYKSGEIAISDGNSGQAKRIQEAGVPVEWVAAEEGTLSWVCGFSISSKAQNLQAAYRLINWQASAEAQAIRGGNGYVVTNPEAMPLVDEDDVQTADPSSLENVIPYAKPPLHDQWIRIFQDFQTAG